MCPASKSRPYRLFSWDYEQYNEAAKSAHAEGLGKSFFAVRKHFSPNPSHCQSTISEPKPKAVEYVARCHPTNYSRHNLQCKLLSTHFAPEPQITRPPHAVGDCSVINCIISRNLKRHAYIFISDRGPGETMASLKGYLDWQCEIQVGPASKMCHLLISFSQSCLRIR